MTAEFQSMVERHKKDRELLSQKHHKEMADLKVRQEQEKSKYRQTNYANNLKENLVGRITSFQNYVPEFSSFNQAQGLD